MGHIPVLLNEVLEYLRPEKSRRIIDATVNGGGHARAILARMPKDGILIGIDRDQEILDNASADFNKDARFIPVHGNFRNIKELTKKYALRWDAILMDLGMSSEQLGASGRGFSFLSEEPLDMRFDPASGLTAYQILNFWRKEELADIFKEYGEERRARQIAELIIRERARDPIRTSGELARIIEAVSRPRFGRQKRIHPATRIFQALRIAVNDELTSLAEGVNEGFEILKKGGRMAVVSFHSLEDRIVKRGFKNFGARYGAKIITKKPIRPGLAEITVNPRSRSAKLRVLQK